uniref:Peptidyl-tRNA hydrolase n=1 Tax=Dictyoglomus thermophilum TaxID=14 RepID=A0A7C3RLW1_DICTH
MDRLGIIGLGNPGKEYENTRHNVGFMVVDYLYDYFSFNKWEKIELNFVSEGFIESSKIYLVKPQTYMNLSGKGVKNFLDNYNLEPQEILIVQDDLDLNLGSIRIRFNGKDGGHNGIKSIIQEIQTSNFYRLRIGIGKPIDKAETINYVLGEFTEEEWKILSKVLNKMPEIINTILKEGWDKAQNLYNRRWLF